MLNQRWRPVLFCGLAIVVIWTAALTGFRLAKNSKPTAEKVRAYVEKVDFAKLPANERERAIAKLGRKLNELSAEERRRAQVLGVAREWFGQMTEQERAQLVDATLPSGFKQMLAAFEQLPQEKQLRTIEDTLARFKQSSARIAAEEGNTNATNRLPKLSPELLIEIRTLGLAAFYSQSSPQTKAELAPVLEELQRVMESGRPFRGR